MKVYKVSWACILVIRFTSIDVCTLIYNLFWILENVISELFECYAFQIDSLTTLGKRKVCALALCVLLTLREPQILDRLEQILRY